MGKETKVGQGTGGAPSSSPPCYLNDVDPAYQGYLARNDLLVLLNELLEAERAGAKVARTKSRRVVPQANSTSTQPFNHISESCHSKQLLRSQASKPTYIDF